MFKQMVALVRGTANDTTEMTLDRNALTILRQQIRDCAQSLARAKNAVAFAMVQHEQEIQQCKKLDARIADLEGRTLSALSQGMEELATEAAETIALLEAERTTSLAAQTRFKSELDRLRQVVRDAERRLRELEHGQKLASATEHTQRLADRVPSAGLATLNDAEATLARLRNRQQQRDLMTVALNTLDQATTPASMAEKLAAAGCGSALHVTAQQVLQRLKQQAAPQNPNSATTAS